MRYRPAPADADRVFRDYQCRWKLLTFEFVCGVFDFVQDAVNEFGVMAGGDDLGWRRLLLKIKL